jgi:uncharacterized membrane protein
MIAVIEYLAKSASWGIQNEFKSMNMKLVKELDVLVRECLISENEAVNIRLYYESKQGNSTGKLFVIFGVLGAAFFSLGVILLLAHNWDDMARVVKTAIAFFPLVIGQLLAGYTLVKKKSIAWKETAATLLFFAVGASMALISQIYNIPGDLTHFLCTWILLGAPLIYLLNSRSIAILHILFCTFYALESGTYFDARTPWLFAPLFSIVVPFYFKELKQMNDQLVTVFNWLIPVSLLVAIGTFVGSEIELALLLFMVLFALLYAIGRSTMLKGYTVLKNGYVFLGALGSACMLIFSSFKFFWEIQSETIDFYVQEFYIASVFVGISIVLLVKKIWKGNLKVDLFEFLGPAFLILFILGMDQATMGILLSNLLIFILGIHTIYTGVQAFSFKKMNFGLVILSALIICRFFDMEMSFMFRGITFLLIGLGFFLCNYMMSKKQEAKQLKNN